MEGLRILRGLLKQQWTLPHQCSWRGIMGAPMVQIVPGTCVLVSCAVCLEARHRLIHEAAYGAGTFALRVAWPGKLCNMCSKEEVWNPDEQTYQKIWTPGEGAALDPVLDMIKRLGGLPSASKPPRMLPLSGYQHHVLFDYSTHRWLVTPREAARLIYLHGPCVAGLYISKDFYRPCGGYSDDDDDKDPGVFRGCTRDPELRALLEEEDEIAGMHAVVCYAYTFVGEELHMRILDNQITSGPRRWVLYEAFDSLVTLGVKAIQRTDSLVRRRRSS